MNNAIKKAGKLSGIVGGVGIFIVGLIILVISIYAFINYHDLDGETYATIVDIKKELIDDVLVDEEDINQDEQYNYIVYVDYNVDGKEYKHIKYDNYNSNMDVGQTIKIQYDTKNPSNIQSTNGKTFIYVFIFLGSITTLFGGYRIIKSIKVDKENSMYNVMRDKKNNS